MHEPAALAEKMAKKLNLDPDQKASLEKILTGLHEVREAEPGHAAHRERWEKILESFKGEQFDFDKVAPMGDVAKHATARLEHMLWAGEAILPVLDPAQRRDLADKLRNHVKESSRGSHIQSVAPGIDPSEE